MDTFFQDHAFECDPIEPGETQEGFVFTPLDAGNKTVHVRLLGSPDTQEFVFSVSVPGLNADYLRHEFEFQEPPGQLIECDIPTLRARLARGPAATSNHGKACDFGDPANLVVIGEFADA